ncbi:sugar-phosphate isomerase, RpiB/LacA/LacB family [Hyaloscypha variabilis F]|uniref:Sugar-phosphate isomerase, RpiB/LacA/LacB family n=1 Tax=Hyaloscypha variabilis (strain UAMH 11265 / GT02V1 / F) TaxID=1149755 RepID=A0A2J6SDV6_HYAVF|nr:sugar-phosphate isomerase, RpiB/LacA/LacB family [Hyaloscypha variabilis F]
MKIAIASDERTTLTTTIISDLQDRGHTLTLFGTLSSAEKPETDWPLTSSSAAEAVARGEDEGIVFCWTGTGASIAANKVAGIRAALCHDAETARGAKKWNHANVLAISLRSTSEAIAKEILDAWFETPFSDDEWNVKQIARIRELEEKHGRRKRTEKYWPGWCLFE